MLNIFKVSHGGKGSKLFSPEELKEYRDRRYITVRTNAKFQGVFQEMNIDDYFYLCHGNDDGIVLLGRVLTKATPGIKGDDWLERSYEIIKELDPPQKYYGVTKVWAPSGFSTIAKVPGAEHDLFEKEILKKYFNRELSNLHNDCTPDSQSASTEQEAPELEALNTIYYGPPGTGKTYELLQLLKDLKEKTSVDQESISKSERAMIMVESNNLSWWKAAALSLLDIGEPSRVPDLRKHPILNAKIKTSSSNDPSRTIWRELQSHTQRSCPNEQTTSHSSPEIFWKDATSLWSIDRKVVEDQLPELLELLNQYQNEETQLDPKRYEFTTFHQAFSYEDFVEGIKPVMDDDSTESEKSDLSYQIEPGIFKRIALRAEDNPDKKYAIFIDEINRGNVASIFGELITLIEPDKRKGKNNEVIVTLPYSKKEFSVPPNLHIIGTMNTADRSIVALDSALRRRFTFIECHPDPKLIEQPDNLAVNLQKLLEVINQRITMILDRDHCIGHSYFMGIESASNPLDALRNVFSRNVIPLLEEYFSGDLARVGMILGEHFVHPVNAGISLAPGAWEPDMELNDVYVLVDVDSLSEEDFMSIYEST